MRPAATALLFCIAAAVPQAGAQVPPSPDIPRPSFTEWLAGVRAEALSRGIREDLVDQALGTVEEPLPVILERDRSQAERVLSLEKYLSRRLTPKLVRRAREMYAHHRVLLELVADRYGVSPRVIVAIWGLESNFGAFSGVRPTIAALATLAWDERRAAFFRAELFNALEILNRGDVEVTAMRGSWAGAMGQPQFMPSSYLEYAQDFDDDGRRDIWSSPADIFASIANYLRGHGWIPGKSWGREVKVSRTAAQRIAAEVDKRQGTCVATRDMSVRLTIERWRALGIRLPSGRALPTSKKNLSATGANDTVALVSGTTRNFLVDDNYDALLAYNCAHSYALSVALLADRVGAGSRPATRATPKPRTVGRR